MFPPKHPYYKVPEEAKKEVKEIVETLATVNDTVEEEYRRYKDDPDYRDVMKNENGGLKAIHVSHKVHTAEKENTFFKSITKDGKGLTSTQLEYCCQDILYRKGNIAILCDEAKYSTYNKCDAALDLLLNGKHMDISSVTELKDNYRNNLSSKNKQIAKYNSLPYVTEKADSVCLYFHDPSMFSPEKVTKGFDELKKMQYTDKETGEQKHKTIRIKHIYCVINEGNGRIEVFDVE